MNKYKLQFAIKLKTHCKAVFFFLEKKVMEKLVIKSMGQDLCLSFLKNFDYLIDKYANSYLKICKKNQPKALTT